MSYATFQQAYFSILHQLYHNPYGTSAAHARPTRELLDFSYSIVGDGILTPHLDFSQTLCPERQEVYDRYLHSEHEWYLSGNPLASSAPSKFWKKLAKSDGTINSNYGRIILHEKKYRGMSAFDHAVQMLNKDRDSRQCIMHYNEPRHYQDENEKDVPCTVAAHFQIRDNALRAHVFQRSCDVVRGLSYDAPFHCWVLAELAKATSSVPGVFTHTIANLHFYEKDVELVKKLLSLPSTSANSQEGPSDETASKTEGVAPNDAQLQAA